MTGDRWLAEDLAQTALASACTVWWRARRADDPDACCNTATAGPGTSTPAAANSSPASARLNPQIGLADLGQLALQPQPVQP